MKKCRDGISNKHIRNIYELNQHRCVRKNDHNEKKKEKHGNASIMMLNTNIILLKLITTWIQINCWTLTTQFSTP